MGKSFIGRNKLFNQLKQLVDKRSASLVVIKGRRRIGKSRLAEEFSKLFERAYLFTGLPPEDTVTADDQRKEFIRQLHEQRIPSTGQNDWGDLFRDLADYCESGPALVVLDEITWMGSLDATFLGKLKIAWDRYFKANPELILIISGSNSAWIERNILSKTGFFGRVSLRLKLEELPLYDCTEFWNAQKQHVSAFEFLKVLSITGGVPRYLEEIQPQLTAEENIYQLCFQRAGVLFNEFDEIFADLFKKRQFRYKELVFAIAEGNKDTGSISKYLGRERGGDLSDQLDELCADGFTSRDYTWDIETGKILRKSQYRIKDNYLRFYLHYILPNKRRIENDDMQKLPRGWEGIIGLQFENLVINNRKRLHELLNVSGEDVVMGNPFLQAETKRHKKCQIDYLLQTRFNTLYVCEIKFRKTEIGKGVVSEMREKIERLVVPRGFSVRPVLIHVNGVTDDLVAQNYFSHIIDFSSFLEKKT